MHGGGPPVTPGAPLAVEYKEENLELLEAGLPNLQRHISLAAKFGVPVVVAVCVRARRVCVSRVCACACAHMRCVRASDSLLVRQVNKFATDTPAEMKLLQAAAAAAGAARTVVSDHFAQGGAGAVELARAVESVCAAERAKGKSGFRFLYELQGTTIKEKIEAICCEIYGADGCDYSQAAEQKIQSYSQLGACARARACVCVRACARARASVRVRACACVRACVCLCLYLSL